MKIAVLGAGSIGCYIGGRLQLAGSEVSYIGRQVIIDAVALAGLRLSDYTGFNATLAADLCRFSTDISAAADADVILIAVKSAATASAATSLRSVISDSAVVVSMQNGLRNPA
ncbi:MAG: 2-dehydropantoate 2-reductase N-terminal domain-containing protein, partial [Mycobacteriaceae bacterium]